MPRPVEVELRRWVRRESTRCWNTRAREWRREGSATEALYLHSSVI